MVSAAEYKVRTVANEMTSYAVLVRDKEGVERYDTTAEVASIVRLFIASI